MCKYVVVVYFRFRELILGSDHFKDFFSLIWIFMENGNKIIVLYDLGTVHFSSVPRIHTLQLRAMNRGS